jgi:lipoprotein-releasing system permease protein
VNVKLWLAARFLAHHTGAAGGGSHGDGQKRVPIWRRMGLPAILSIIGLAIGVASLTVAMAVVSGFEATLRSALIDVFGDLLVVRRGEEPLTLDRARSRLQEALPDMVGLTPFITLEAIVVGQGKLNGVVIQGVDEKSVDSVLKIRSRVIRGEFDVGSDEDARGAVSSSHDDVPHAMVGKALAKRFGLGVGDRFKVVIPKPSAQDTSAFVSSVAELKVTGIIDFGKSDYDERTVVTSIAQARKIGGISAPFVGLRVKLKDSARAQQAAIDLTRALGSNWWIMDWTEGNRNFFRAIKYERVAIFFVIFIMVIAASFNVASNIFIGVLRRTSDVSILRALGLSKQEVATIFRYQGFLFGVVGTACGLFLGVCLAGAFLWAQSAFDLLPAEVYKLNKIGVEFDPIDIGIVVVAAVTICVVASLAPAARAAQLDPVEGLRHD